MAVQILISVAMCTLNGEKYLQEQLDSIAAQTVLPSEIVICDDGSRDRTIEIIQTFAATTSIPIHLHFNMENLGVAHNFFKAIKLCKSDWVMLCDQDDVWTKERVSIFGDAIKSNISVNVILTDGKLVDCNMKFLNQTLFQAYRLTRNERASINTGHGFKVLVRHLFATGAGMTIRKSLVLSIPEPVEDFLHDEWMIWFACPNLLIIDKPTFFYRQHSNQVTGINGRLRAQYKRFQQPQQKSTMTIDQRPMFEERRWGEYKVLEYVTYDDGILSLAKHMFIKAGEKISYQTHSVRDEVWTFVDGAGEFLLEGQVRNVRRGDVIYIAKGMKHAVKATTDLHFVEVQIGEELTESDIERFDWEW